jgi:hypothetical protein
MPIALKVGPDGSGGQGGARRMDTTKVRSRRNLLVATGSGEGPLTEPTAAAKAGWPEPIFMPESG